MARSLGSSFVLAWVACSAPASPRVAVTPPQPVTPPVLLAAPVDAPPAQVASDVPALRLPKTFVATGYTATLTIDPAKPRFTGRVVLAGTITEATSVVWLHAKGLEFSGVTAAGTPPTLTRHGDDLIALRVETPLQPGPWTVTFDYTGPLDPLNTVGAFVQKVAGASYVYTQLEALYARRVFPCIDEPDSKVPWQLTLEVPKTNIAVSNTPVVRETDGGSMRRYEFAKTKPLPSYLVAFGVGPFDVVDAGKTKSGVPVRVVTLRGRGPDAAYAAETTARVLDLLETWFGTPYPYEKLDLLTVPLAIGFGAMENAGLVTFVESIILFDPKTIGWMQRRTFINIASHELAHQWFGDLVTMTWWDDLWLNEGFATWLATKIAGKFDPTWQIELGAVSDRNWALEIDSLVSARRVRQPIQQVDEIEAAFDGITYDKGAAILAMFESYVGADVFQRGVREYVKSRAYGNATSADFVGALSAAAKSDLAPAFSSFLDQVGAPQLDTRLVCDKAGPRMELEQQRHVAPGSPTPPAQTWQLPVCVAYDKGGKRATACTLLTETTGMLPLPAKTCPRWVVPNLEGRGYYRVRYTQQQAQGLRDEAWPQLTAAEQLAVFSDVQTSIHARARRLPLALTLSFVPKLLAKPNRFTVSEALSTSLAVDRLVPTDLADKYAHYMRATFGPGAAKLGLVTAVKDTLDDEATRHSLVSAVAWHGREPELVAKAIELISNWRDLPASVRVLVLQIAVDADANIASKIMRDVRSERDRTRRSEMLAALGSQRDPKRYEAALELIFDPALDPRESMAMMWSSSVEATRAVAERFLRVNEAKLLASLPDDPVLGVRFASVLSDSCDAAKRDEAKAYALAHYGKRSGGDLPIVRVFEAMDQCIAARELTVPQLRGWLGGIRLPRKTK